MRVFLTGGTGLVGSHVAERLRAEGQDVVALVRRGSDRRHLAGIGCHPVEGAVEEGVPDLARAMAGCSHVIHAAAMVYARATWEEVEAVNVTGTRTVVAAAAAADVGHVVHVSSVAVYGQAAPGVDDGTPESDWPPVSSLYGRSKRMAEHAARDAAARAALRLTLLRPASVYGERDRLFTPRVARLTRLPLTPTLGDGRNTIPAVYAGNVADAVWRALVADRSGGTYDVALDHPLTQRELLLGIARGMGRGTHLLPVPGALVRGAARMLEALRVPTPGAPDLPLGRVVTLALQDNPYGSKRIRDELGWRPPYRHEEALPRTGAWLAQERGVSR